MHTAQLQFCHHILPPHTWLKEVLGLFDGLLSTVAGRLVDEVDVEPGVVGGGLDVDGVGAGVGGGAGKGAP
jgi:hypothetical protein